ncbi:MAG: CoA transferase [Lachnospiraceae bacterium]|nr:CoA transferase [Lachnospiraceae bacterium]
MAEEGVLKGITVLDLTRVVAGPFCGAILGDLGAKVIKIERPEKGDDSRAYAPYINGESLYYANLNRNKYGITLNLKTEQGKEIIKGLVKKADILIENFRPGVMERLGLGYHNLIKINSKLIYGAVSGFGSYGPYKERPGYDIIAQAMGGLMSITGQKGNPPTRAGSAMGDMLGGLNLTIGVLAALQARERTGKGRKVDIALTDCVVASLEQTIQRYVVSGKNPERNGNTYAAIAPYDTFRARDGYVVIGCGNQKLFEAFCRDIMKKPEIIVDARFLTVPLRVENNEELKGMIEEWTSKRSVEEIVNAVLKAQIPASPIFNVEDVVKDPHIAKAREMIVKNSHPVMGEIILNGNPIKILGAMPKIRKPSPILGEDTESILGEYLNISGEEIRTLRKKGVL